MWWHDFKTAQEEINTNNKQAVGTNI